MLLCTLLPLLHLNSVQGQKLEAGEDYSALKSILPFNRIMADLIVTATLHFHQPKIIFHPLSKNQTLGSTSF